jgi:hypothetical protein
MRKRLFVNVERKILVKKEKSFVFESIAEKIVVDKSTLTRRSDVCALFLLLLLVSHTKNRLRDKSNEHVKLCQNDDSETIKKKKNTF